ncbi:MAG: hypothetical protein IPJ97_08020 [Proteobacteria bacterium]|nr:hypothetical protein [Pseudomonadota bacterium]
MIESVWQRRWLPAFAFMSIVIGGGYATGREVVEFFLAAGPVAGLAGLAVTAATWSVVAALSFELAREASAFDYRRFFRVLLGRAWPLFDLSYVALLVLVLCVLGAAAGEIGVTLLGVPKLAGAIVLLSLVTLFAYFGTAAIERLFSVWGIGMCVAYAALLATSLWLFRDSIVEVLVSNPVASRSWVAGGLQYAGYNVAVIPAILYCVRYQRSRRDALVSGALCGPIAILPGLCLYLALLAVYPAALDAPIPLQLLLQRIDLAWLKVGLQVMIFGTLVQTGIGVLRDLPRGCSPMARQARATTHCVARPRPLSSPRSRSWSRTAQVSWH